MIIKKTIQIVLLIGAAAAMLAACGPKNSPEPFGGGKNAADTAAAAKAMEGASEPVQALYKQRCLSCHGGALEGKVGPSTNLQQVGGRFTKEQIAAQIARGGGGMPGFQDKLSAEEIEGLSAWLAGKK
ncbi:cytochrome c class I [Paenibacillus mucilaginosus 3016]|uniref:Cytochrome c class I n=2 Tax=Paenibacillus mucilaginosus TaxID=61624 RepID=H6NSL6_9BACL|nr:cytochrome c [Paenibacillus mucilaginosus]AFC27437.1 cytochrome c class I [Paenibacillus mucilaginosus 3016]AFH59584.1 cytochrome C [Paenibacillus mucilaginosus K02]WFA16342.1 cytochrome c [Paenibacillus mucilaginosus]